MRARLVLGTMLLAAACEGAAGGGTDPAAPTAAEVRPPVPEKPAVRPRPLGWWRSNRLCLELFANGDFELAVLGPGPKVLVMGAATIAPEGDGFALELAVARIWRTRYTGKCRKTHELGRWKEMEHTLGVTLSAGRTTSLQLKRFDGDRGELCGGTCVTLVRAIPDLGGTWQAPGLDRGARKRPAFAAGDLLEVQLSEPMPALRIADGSLTGILVLGRFAVQFLGDDRFRVYFTPRDQGRSLELLGTPLPTGRPLLLTMHRLSGERLEVCPAPDRCTVLDRHFDAFDHDIR